MADLVNTSGFRSAAAASGAPPLRLDAIDYDMINRGFAEGFAQGKKILDDLRDLEIAPQVQALKKKSIEAESLNLDRIQSVLSGETPAVRQEGDFDIATLSGAPIGRRPAPTQDSLTLQTPDGGIVRRDYVIDPRTGVRTQVGEDIEILPAAPKDAEATVDPLSESDPDPLDFSAEQTSQPGATSGAQHGVRSVGPKGVVLGVQKTRAAAGANSSGGGDSYSKQADNDYLKDSADAAATAQRVLPKLQAFAKLNKGTSSGPLVGSRPVAWVRSLFDGDVATLNAFTNDFAKLAREGFPGSVSNAEMNLFRSAGPSVANPEKTNATLVSVMMPVYQRSAEKYGMAREWVSRNGSLDGFDGLWNQYINEVPTVPEAVLGRASSGKKEDVAAALDMLANTPAQPRVGFKDFVALKRFGRVPNADIQTLSNKGASILVGPDGELKAPEVLRQEVEASIRAKYPSAPSSEQNLRAAANYDAATEAILEGATRAGLNSAVDDAVQPTPAPAAAPAGKTIGDVLNKEIDPTRESLTLPSVHPTTKLPDGRTVTMIDDPTTAEVPLPDRVQDTGFDGVYEEYAGIPGPFKLTGGDLIGRVIEAVGGPEAPGKMNTGEVSDKFLSFLEKNREKIASDPRLRAKVNFVVRDSVAAYVPEQQAGEGQRWYESNPSRIDTAKTLQRRARLQAALFSARLNGLVRLPSLASEPAPSAVPSGIDDTQVVTAR